MSRFSAVVALVILLSAACGSSGPLVVDASSDGAADYSFTIPPGSGEAIDRGEPLDILPGELEARVGEVFELVNLDDRGHLVGPFFVGEGEIMRQRFNSPGEFVGACSVHPSGEFVLTVVE
jgi:hypothetical protein